MQSSNSPVHHSFQAKLQKTTSQSTSIVYLVVAHVVLAPEKLPGEVEGEQEKAVDYNRRKMHFAPLRRHITGTSVTLTCLSLPHLSPTYARQRFMSLQIQTPTDVSSKSNSTGSRICPPLFYRARSRRIPSLKPVMRYVLRQ